jgi:hypothetical protein
VRRSLDCNIIGVQFRSGERVGGFERVTKVCPIAGSDGDRVAFDVWFHGGTPCSSRLGFEWLGENRLTNGAAYPIERSIKPVSVGRASGSPLGR